MPSYIDEMIEFDPSNLSAFNTPVTNSDPTSGNIYRTRCKDSKSEDGHYRSVVRLVNNPYDYKNSIVTQVAYNLNDENGFFQAKSKLANGDRSCPLFTAFKKLRYSGDTVKEEYAKKNFDKSETKWVTVQIVEDENFPELVGSYKIMKLPKAIYAKLAAKMNPAAESKKPAIPLMDFLIGCNLEIDVKPGPDDKLHPERKARETSYDLCEFSTEASPIKKIDNTDLFAEEELELIEEYAKARNIYATGIAKNPDKIDTKTKAAGEKITAIKDKVRELYQKALDYLKDEAKIVNVQEEAGYSEWDETLTKRVNNWIELALSMKLGSSVTVGDAKTDPLAAAPATPATTAPATPALENPLADVDPGADGLPF